MIEELLLKFGLQDARSVNTPIVLDHDNDEREVNPLLSRME